MFWRLRELVGSTVQAEDGEVGTISDILFDELRWIVRYMIVDSGKFLDRKRVLLAPHVFGTFDRDENIFPVKLTSERIASSPDFGDSDPVTRDYETEIHYFYNWPAYWEEANEVPPVEAGLSGWSVTEMMTDVEGKRRAEAGEEAPHMSSFTEVRGYSIQSRKGEEIAKVDDFIINSESWRIMYMVVSTGGLLPGKRVLVSPSLVTRFDWENSMLEMDITGETIENSPEFNPDLPFSSEDETQLYPRDEEL